VGQTLTLSGFPVSTFLNGQSVTVLSSGFSSTQFQANLPHADVSSATENGIVSLPGTVASSLLTMVDFSGDTVLATPAILANPNWLDVDPSGAYAFVINSAGSLNEIPIGNPATLIASEILQSTLAAGASPVSVTYLALGGTSTVFVPEPGLSQVAALSTGASLALLQNISVSNNPIYVVGVNNALRAYVISEGDGVSNGFVSSIEAQNLAKVSTIPVGVSPVYGMMTADGKRAFFLNKGSGTVSVLNVINNGLDQNSTLGSGSTITVGQNPVWADFSPANSELVVLNQGDGIHPGSLSLISIPLCSALAQPTNPNCNASNPVDAATFGTVLATVPVGVNPTMVSVLQDGTNPKAYVANSGNAAASIEGSVSVVNLTSDAVTTIPAVSSASATIDTTTTPADVYGHPNSIAATTGTPTGKVYVTSPDNKYMTVIETDTDTVDTHINLQGLGVRVQVTAP
jgi:DNA-binding beta-propeller fold protein YncE